MGSTVSKISRAAGRFIDRVDRCLARLGRWIFRDDELELDPVEPSAYGNFKVMEGTIRRPKAKHGRLSSIVWKGERECSCCCECSYMTHLLISVSLPGNWRPARGHAGPAKPGRQNALLAAFKGSAFHDRRRPVPKAPPADGPVVHFDLRVVEAWEYQAVSKDDWQSI